MSNTVSLSGQDTAIINDRVLTDLADGDCIVMEFPNELMAVKKGKNGNTIYGFNAQGELANITIRVIRGSADDKFLNGLLSQQRANGASFPLLTGEFIKLLGDGLGNVLNDTYILGGGVFRNQVAAKSNVEGDAAQSVAEYKFTFGNAPRALT